MSRLLLTLLALPALLLALPGPAHAQTPDLFRQDAQGIERWINQNYAYLDRLPDGSCR